LISPSAERRVGSKSWLERLMVDMYDSRGKARL